MVTGLIEAQMNAETISGNQHPRSLGITGITIPKENQDALFSCTQRVIMDSLVQRELRVVLCAN